jgi:putative phosphoesterase
MRIAVLSDTHLEADVPRELLDIIGDADVVVHAGDFVSRAVYEEIRAGSKMLVAVHGNTDSAELMSLLPESAIFEAGGIRIGVIHRGRHGTDPTHMRYLALEMGVNVLIFGHIHRPLIDRTDVLLLCPGSPTVPRMADPSMALLDIEGGEVKVSIIKVTTGQTCGYIDFARSLGDREQP